MATSLFYVLSMQISCVLLLHLSRSVNSVSFRLRAEDVNENKKYFQEDVAISIDASFYVTHLTYKGVVPIWDSNTRKLTDFSTRFSFTADTRRATRDDGGMAFFLAPVGFGIPAYTEVGYLGLYDKSYTGSSSKTGIVHVEFDAGINTWDPSFEHVGINVNSLTSSRYTRWYSSSHSLDTADVLISYDSVAKNLSVSWEYRRTSTFSEKTFLSYQVDLRDVLPPQVVVGFSAATSVYLQRPAVFSWDFTSSFNMDQQTSENNGNKTEVKNNGNKTEVKNNGNKGKFDIVMGVLVGVLFIVMAIMS